MNRTRVVLCLILVCLGAQNSVGQQFWEAKPYQQWTKEEAAQLLRQSPWARQYILSDVQVQSPASRTGSAYERVSESTPKITYTVQLRSAKPVRQAIVRLGQIEAHYDAMDAGQKKQFDANAAQFIDQKFSERIVVYVSYGSNVRVWADELQRYWQAETTDLLRNSIFLYRGEERLPLMNFQATQGQAFQLTFARPATVRADAKLALEFQHPGIGISIGDGRILIDFKMADLRLQGVPEF